MLLQRRNHVVFDGHDLKRIQIADFHAQLLGEEVLSEHHGRATTGQIEMRGLAPLLLGPIHADRAVDLTMKAGHDVTDDLGDRRRYFRFRLFVGTAQGNKAVRPLECFGLFVADAELFGNLLRN